MSSQMFAHGFAHGGMSPLGFFPYGLIGWAAGLLLIAGLVLFAVWAVREMAGPRMAAAAQPAAPAPTALEVLQRRFAAGEMSAEEYTRARDTLSGSPPPPPA